MALHHVLINGNWQASQSRGNFQAENPRLQQQIDGEYPVSSWTDCNAALDAACDAFHELRTRSAEEIARFLEAYADRIEARSDEICQLAHQETALPVEPRLAGVELPRTTGQLRKAAAAARAGSWCLPTIDTEANIRSMYGPLGPVAVFGPNNFPLAFNGISGGDFAAAIAAGNPVICKANSMHPGTTRLLAEEAQKAAAETNMPAGIVQLIYRMSHEDGERLASDSRLAAIGYTGSRGAGLKLKAAADAVGKPIYLELSSVNPVVILPQSLKERQDAIVDEFVTSCLMGTGQFCTNPGLVVLYQGTGTDQFIEELTKRFTAAPVGTLLSGSGQTGLAESIAELTDAGAEILCGGETGGGEGYCCNNTILKVAGSSFLRNPERLQTEAFGNCTLLVVVDSDEQAVQVIANLEGNLTGCIYSANDGSDDAAYDLIEPQLRLRVGRLLNDKMPTGVAVSPAMNHGGPYPATGHPGFTAVGIPASILRFGMLQCYDNVRPHRLPVVLQDENPLGAWRLVDGTWTNANLAELISA